MADYFEPTIIQQTIPDGDMTRLERLLLSHIFECEQDGEGWYFYADQGPSTEIWVTMPELKEALEVRPDPASVAHIWVTEQLAAIDPDDEAAEIELDLSGVSWEFFLQNIVKRSRTLTYVSVVAAFTCSRMRPDGFGGAATLITADAILGKSTVTLIEDFLADAGLDGSAGPGGEVTTPAVPGGEAP